MLMSIEHRNKPRGCGSSIRRVENRAIHRCLNDMTIISDVVRCLNSSESPRVGSHYPTSPLRDRLYRGGLVGRKLFFFFFSFLLSERRSISCLGSDIDTSHADDLNEGSWEKKEGGARVCGRAGAAHPWIPVFFVRLPSLLTGGDVDR